VGETTVAVRSDAGGAHGFLKTLVEAVPYGVAVFDGENRVQAVNANFERILGIEEGEALRRRGPEFMACCRPITYLNRAGGWPCGSCQARSLVVQALIEKRTSRFHTTYQVAADGVVEDMDLVINAAPFEFGGQKFVVVFLEDIGKVLAVRHRTADGPGTHGIVGTNPRMLELFDAIRSVGPTNAPVLIQGESGAGKELVAIALHRESPRATRLMVPVNCGALAEGVLESELFGHVKGAFTGAIRDKKGRFELADGGTIFLDEVAELPPVMQVRLLRVLQDGTFERVGGEETVKVDVRVICATNKNLASEVARGRFRSDLFYRLSVFPIAVPPLRERAEDLPLLAAHLLAVAADDGNRPCPGLSPGALEVLRRHTWPGNVRELDNTLRYALIRSAGAPILAEHLPPSVRCAEPPASQSAKRPRKVHSEAVAEALRATGGNKVKAAEILGVGRATLYRYLADDDFATAGT
jgi:transcriptional regulator with PAS, ATPase and Fis domain